MKITMRYPVIAWQSGKGPATVMKAGEFEIEAPSDHEFPLEIDYADRSWNIRQQYRMSESEGGLYRAFASLNRIAKIEAKKMAPTFADQHPLWEMFKLARHATGYAPFAPEEELQRAVIKPDDAKKAYAEAREILSSLRLCEGQLWTPSNEPYFHVTKGRPKWRAVISETDNVYFGPNEYIYGIHEYDQLQAFFEQQVANGEEVSETELFLGGKFEYRTDSMARSVIAAARSTVGYYGNVTSDSGTGHMDYRLSAHTVPMLEAYLALRKIVEEPLANVDEDDIVAVFDAHDILKAETKKLGLKMILNPQVIEQQRERWNDRPVSFGLEVAPSVPR
jgi:hypothetical protein|nr:hypothetical protein [Neorhizobium tomejilense]